MITLHCLHYDPYYCSTDAERIWSLVQRAGGSCSAGMIGCVDFYVPDRILALVLLLEPNLKRLHSKSYI